MESKQFAVMLPADLVEFIERRAKELMISRAAVLRQIIATAIRKDSSESETSDQS